MFILHMYVNFISHFMVSNKLLEFGLRGFPLNFYIWVFMLPLQIHLFLFLNKASYWFIYLSMWMTLFSLVTTLAFSMSLSSNSVRRFELKDLRDLHYFLGPQITRTTIGLFLHQAKYAHDLLIKHNTLSSKPAKTLCTPHLRLVPDEGSLLANPHPYRSLVGSLHYLTFT